MVVWLMPYSAVLTQAAASPSTSSCSSVPRFFVLTDEIEPTCQCPVEDPPEYEGGEPVTSHCGASFPRDSDEWSDHFKSHFDNFNSQARVECPWCGGENVQIIRHMLGHLEIPYVCRYGCLLKDKQPRTFTRKDAARRHAKISCSEYLPWGVLHISNAHPPSF